MTDNAICVAGNIVYMTGNAVTKMYIVGNVTYTAGGRSVLRSAHHVDAKQPDL